jgi:hypothetical protein
MRIGPSLALCTIFAACAETVHLPDGNYAAGKETFSELQCYSCHEVVGENYPDPSAITPTFVTLGSPQKKLSRPYLVESIIAPSHQFAEPQLPPGQTGGVEGIKSGPKSRMTDYSGRLTVRQLLDLVAYRESLQEREL